MSQSSPVLAKTPSPEHAKKEAVSIVPENSLASLYPHLITGTVSATSPPVTIPYLDGCKFSQYDTGHKSKVTLIYAGKSTESMEVYAKRKEAAAEFLLKHSDTYYLADDKKCVTLQEYVAKFHDDLNFDTVLWFNFYKYRDCRKYRILQFLTGVNALNPGPTRNYSGDDYNTLVKNLKQTPAIEDIVHALFPSDRQFLFTEIQLKDLVPVIKECNDICFRMKMYKLMQDALLAIMHKDALLFVWPDDRIIAFFHAKSMQLSVQTTNDGLDIALTPIADKKKTKRELQQVSLRVEGRDVHILFNSGLEMTKLVDQIRLDVPKEKYEGFDLDFYKEDDSYRVSIFCNGLWDFLSDKTVQLISRSCFKFLFEEYV